MYRIMIVEDDTAMADVMKKQIESWGNQVMRSEERRVGKECAA